jgi:hypothetical protein
MIFDAWGSHVRFAGPRKNFRELASCPPETWSARAATTLVYVLFPNTVLVFHPETVSHVAVFPTAIDSVTVVHTMLAPREPADDEERQAWERTWELIDADVFAKEDLSIVESIQTVLGTGATPTFRLGRSERPVGVFHETLARTLAEREPD